MDLAELSERARKGEPLYGTSPQPDWVQMAAAGNSTYSALKFSEPVNLVIILDLELMANGI